MGLSINSSKREQLIELEAVIRDRIRPCWLFPTEDVVQGFLGTGPIFIVGIRPSQSEWGPKHPRRRFFYDLLARIGAANAHLTDIYKRPGHSEETEVGLQEDFQEHLLFLQKELEILCPLRVLALGHAAYTSLMWHIPELKPKLKWVRHFSWAVRSGKRSEYELELSDAIEGV